MAKLSLSLFGLACLASTLSAAPVTFTRGLPNSSNVGTPYVNNAAGANRANTSWNEPGSGFIFGDDFSFGSAVTLSSLTVWMTTNSLPGTPASEFSAIQLYLGNATGTLSLVNVAPSTAPVQYQPDNANYQAPSGNFYAIYSLTFDLAGLGLVVPANTLWGFAIDGTPIGINVFSTHASNAALTVASGVTQQGADDSFRYYFQSGSDYVYSPPICDAGCSNFASDLNVLVQADDTAIPEPSTVFLTAAGILTLAGLRRRRA